MVDGLEEVGLDPSMLGDDSFDLERARLRLEGGGSEMDGTERIGRCSGWWVAEDEVDAGWIPRWEVELAAARRKDGTALLDFRVAPFIYAGRLG